MTAEAIDSAELTALYSLIESINRHGGAAEALIQDGYLGTNPKLNVAVMYLRRAAILFYSDFNEQCDLYGLAP